MTGAIVVAGSLAAMAAMLWLMRASAFQRERGFQGVNGLRALAATLVLTAHVTETTPLPPGSAANLVVSNFASAVTLFFVLSGFLLWTPFVRALLDDESLSVHQYAINRFLRIVPLYTVITVLVWVRAGAPLTSLLRSLTFSGNGDTNMISVAWSLQDEVAFYLFLPLLFAALTLVPARLRHRACATAIAALVLAAVAYQLDTFVAPLRVGSLPDAYVSPAPQFAAFGLGMLLAMAVDSVPRARGDRPARVFLSSGALLAIVAGAALGYVRLGLREPVMAVGFALLIWLTITARPRSLMARIARSVPVILLGELSYGIYLWHEPVHHALFNVGGMRGGFLPSWLVLASATAMVATGTYFLVERPFLGLRRRWKPRQLVGPVEARPGSPQPATETVWRTR